ncbi:TonB-linked outer membrane protein, SusC/RagA family [Aquimarina amphilecti]|uniref:TonB-linked outer membrane protein, SusC/RagA family n=1 Tax=Aquimarina amphilecti TaxID=1038014 RepID=A0A1H7RYZ1_AQUAM|nr:TonB-dependent receptor [Aquimarina amphilecti]SEL64587.1 TonB-linked outer membrane protein, SusC/RagA family [Aquimarina amphilecti]
MERKVFNRIMILLIGLTTTFVSAQQTVSGTVNEPNGPLPGVNILVKGTDNGTTTDFDGKYLLNNVADDAILIFSYVGFLTTEIPVNGQTVINITLEEDSAALDEIVIVGYGSAIKRDLTTSVSSIKGDDVTKTAVASNPVTALQGRVPGIQVESFGGQPGGRANVFIRGVNSLSNADPLFIVDGLFVDSMEYINPADIADISILKDAAAAAIYGARAANGVVLIKTNHGKKSEKIEVKVNLRTGIDTPSKKLDFINGQQYTDYINQRFANDGIGTVVNWNGVNTDWQKENISSAIVQDYGFSISGGGENSTHFVSANYFNQDGILVGSGFERINFRFNNKFDMGKFHVTQSLGITQGQLQENRWYGFDGTTAPTVAFSNPNNDGGFEAPSTDVQGPGGINQYARAVLENNLVTTRTLFGGAKFDYDITENFTASVNFGVDYTNQRTFEFTPTFFMSSIDAVRNDNQENDLTDFREETLNLLVEPTISYQQDFGEHKVSGVLGYTYFLENQQSSGVYGQGTQSNSIQVVSGLPPNDQLVLLGEDNTAGLESIFGRLNYNYNSRYLFSATLRRDASSRFAKDNQVGYFPSFSAAWNISNESFWNSETINYLKLRASYGELGSYPDVFYPTEAVFISNQSNTSFGGAPAPGLAQTTLADPDLIWETTKTFDVGIDVSLLNNSINFTMDYYSKDIEDVLVGINVPSTTGVSLPVTRNAGDLINKGLEFNLDYKKREGDFQYTIGTNFSFNLKSEAGDIPNPILGPQIDEDLRVVNRTQANAPIGAFYGFIVEDRVNPTTGDFVRRDINGDGTIDNDDITIIGNPVPDFTYGLTFDATYKNFDLGLNFSGVQGNDIYNLSRYYNILWQDGGKLTEVLNSWTPTNTDTNIPRASVSDGAGNKAPSSFFVEDGSYFRLKTLEVGYNFDTGALGTELIKDLRLAFNVQNVFVITDYSGYDPDVSSTDGGRASLNSGVPGLRDNVNPLLGRGLDARAYPNARTFSFSIQATF